MAGDSKEDAARFFARWFETNALGGTRLPGKAGEIEVSILDRYEDLRCRGRQLSDSATRFGDTVGSVWWHGKGKPNTVNVRGVREAGEVDVLMAMADDLAGEHRTRPDEMVRAEIEKGRRE